MTGTQSAGIIVSVMVQFPRKSGSAFSKKTIDAYGEIFLTGIYACVILLKSSGQQPGPGLLPRLSSRVAVSPGSCQQGVLPPFQPPFPRGRQGVPAAPLCGSVRFAVLAAGQVCIAAGRAVWMPVRKQAVTVLLYGIL